MNNLARSKTPPFRVKFIDLSNTRVEKSGIISTIDENVDNDAE